MSARRYLFLTIALLLVIDAYASYAIYVGKNLTEDGSVFILSLIHI